MFVFSKKKLVFVMIIPLIGLNSCAFYKNVNNSNESSYWKGNGSLYGLNLRTDLKESDKRDDKLLAIAEQYLGLPYSYGSQGPDSIDCSALVRQVFWRAEAYLLPRRAAWQIWEGEKVELKNLKKGDLLFFGKSIDEVSHVGIYNRDGYFINATFSRGVIYSNLKDYYWKSRYLTSRRLL